MDFYRGCCGCYIDMALGFYLTLFLLSSILFIMFYDWHRWTEKRSDILYVGEVFSSMEYILLGLAVSSFFSLFARSLRYIDNESYRYFLDCGLWEFKESILVFGLCRFFYFMSKRYAWQRLFNWRNTK